jgi:hypothetical protein
MRIVLANRVADGDPQPRTPIDATEHVTCEFLEAMALSEERAAGGNAAVRFGFQHRYGAEQIRQQFA